MKEIQHPGFMNALEPLGNLPTFPAFPRKKVGPRIEGNATVWVPENPNVQLGLDGKAETKLVYTTAELWEIHELPVAEKNVAVKRVRKVQPATDITDGVYALNNDVGGILGYVAVIEGVGHFPSTGYTCPAKSISLAVKLIGGVHCGMHMSNAISHGFYLGQKQRDLVHGTPKFINGVYTVLVSSRSWFVVRDGVRYKYHSSLEQSLSYLKHGRSMSTHSNLLPTGYATFVQPLPA